MSSRSGSAEIWICNSEGTDLLQLTTMGGSWLTSGDPRWSPDGQRIVFSSRKDGHWQIYVVSIESRVVRQLTAGPNDSSRPSWSRDGHWIYYHSEVERSGQIWRIPSEGGSPVQITHDKGDEPFEAWDGKSVYYVKSHAIWKVPSEGGTEALVVDHAVRTLGVAPSWPDSSQPLGKAGVPGVFQFCNGRAKRVRSCSGQYSRRFRGTRFGGVPRWALGPVCGGRSC